MPIIVLRVDSNPNLQPSNIIPYDVKKQPIRLKKISVNFYNPADNSALADDYTRTLYVDFSFLNSFSVITNGSLGGSGYPVPIKRGEHSQIITGIDIRFDPHENIDANFNAGVFVRHSATKYERYSGFYTNPDDEATKTDVHVSFGFYFEYDILEFTN